MISRPDSKAVDHGSLQTPRVSELNSDQFDSQGCSWSWQPGMEARHDWLGMVCQQEAPDGQCCGALAMKSVTSIGL